MHRVLKRKIEQDHSWFKTFTKCKKIYLLVHNKMGKVAFLKIIIYGDLPRPGCKCLAFWSFTLETKKPSAVFSSLAPISPHLSLSYRVFRSFEARLRRKMTHPHTSTLGRSSHPYNVRSKCRLTIGGVPSHTRGRNSLGTPSTLPTWAPSAEIAHPLPVDGPAFSSRAPSRAKRRAAPMRRRRR